jgi:ferredoxin
MDQDRLEKQIGKYKVVIDRSLCIGAASCIALSPSVFDLDTEGKAVFVDGAEDSFENIVLAAQSCPTRAVIIEDTETGELIWPK